MCVILASNKKKAPLEWLDAAADKNKDGYGLAWLENGKVRFRKSMTLAPIKALYQRITPPYIFHARIASQGGVSLKLCHPFPINEKASLEPDGVADSVLAHNGNLWKWDEMCRDAVLRHRLKWPFGPWSDSRAMAWLCFHFGINFADLLDEKIAILNNKKVRIYGKGWTEKDGVQLSNTFFLPTEPVVTTYHYDRGGHQPPYGQNVLALKDKCANEMCRNGREWDLATSSMVPCSWCSADEYKGWRDY